MAGRGRNIQQIRFVNGMEALANIVQWEEDMIEANNVLLMEPLYSDEDDKAYYVLKPMVSYTDDLGRNITINPGSIICVAEPSEIVMRQYESSIRDIIQQMGGEDVADGNVVSFDSRKRILLED